MQETRIATSEEIRILMRLIQMKRELDVIKLSLERERRNYDRTRDTRRIVG